MRMPCSMRSGRRRSPAPASTYFRSSLCRSITPSASSTTSCSPRISATRRGKALAFTTARWSNASTPSPGALNRRGGSHKSARAGAERLDLVHGVVDLHVEIELSELRGCERRRALHAHCVIGGRDLFPADPVLRAEEQDRRGIGNAGVQFLAGDAALGQQLVELRIGLAVEIADIEHARAALFRLRVERLRHARHLLLPAAMVAHQRNEFEA